MPGNASPPPPARLRLRLGLVADAAAPGGSVVPLTALQRAGWAIVWTEPGVVDAVGLPVGRIVGPGAPLPHSGDGEVWLRGERGPEDVTAAVSSLRGLDDPPPISVDAHDAAAAELAGRLGVTPVLGPAPLPDLLSMAAAHGSAGGLAVLLPVSIGRTDAEARARLHGDAWLAARERDGSLLVGTLEDCQDAMIALAHAGVGDLRLRPAITADLLDVLAQLSALGRSPLGRLRPGVPRSPAPPAPADWGGRPGG